MIAHAELQHRHKKHIYMGTFTKMQKQMKKIVSDFMGVSACLAGLKIPARLSQTGLEFSAWAD